MKRNKVNLGEPVRQSPKRVYVRQVVKTDEIIPTRNILSPDLKNVGCVSPPRGEIYTPTFTEKVEAVVKQWRELDNMARKEALAMMSLEQQRSPSGQAGDLDLWAEATYEALRRVVGSADGAAYAPQVVKRVMGAYSAWEPVAEFITMARLDSLRPAERYAVFQLLAKLLVERARRVANKADIPLTPKLVAQNAMYLAGIFDNAFPGYLSAGLVASVSRRLIEGRRVNN